jgi:hypothetical protein
MINKTFAIPVDGDNVDLVSSHLWAGSQVQFFPNSSEGLVFWESSAFRVRDEKSGYSFSDIDEGCTVPSVHGADAVFS